MLKLWDITTGYCVRIFDSHMHFVNSVSFSPDGRFALSGSSDSTLKLWDIATGFCLRTYRGHGDPLNSVSFSADGRYALSGSGYIKGFDNTLELWDVATGVRLRTIEGNFEGHKKEILSVAFSPDGRYAISGSRDWALKLWDISTNRCLLIFKKNMDIVNTVSFSPNGHFVLSGCWRKINLWDVATGQCLRTFEGHKSWVNSVAFSPDGRYALSGSDDQTLKLWELDWEYEFPGWADWDDGAEPYLQNFLTLRNGTWNEEDFKTMLDELSKRGYGWLKPEGVHHKLEELSRRLSPPQLPDSPLEPIHCKLKKQPRKRDSILSRIFKL